MKGWLLIIVVALGLAAAMFGVRTWQEQQRLGKLRAAVQTVIGKDNGYTEVLLKIEADASSMNYEELFSLCDRTIKGRNDLLVDLRGLGASGDFPVVEQIVAFMDMENEWVRAKRSFYQRQMTLNGEAKRYTSLVAEVKAYQPAFSELEKFRHKELTARMQMVDASRALESAATILASLYQLAVAQETRLEAALAAAGFRKARLFSHHRQANMKAVDLAHRTVESVRGPAAVPASIP